MQAWDRYAYVNNNAVKYNDPSGHCLLFPLCVVAAYVGGALLGAAIYSHLIHQPSAPANVDIATVGDAMAAGYEHAGQGTIVGEGLQSLQDDPSVQAAQDRILKDIRLNPQYGQKSFTIDEGYSKTDFTANGPSGNFVRAGFEWNQAFLMVHSGTLYQTNTTVLADGTIITKWKVDDTFDYRPAWKDHFREGYRYWAYNVYAQIVSPIYNGVFAAQDYHTNAYWSAIYRLNSIPK